MNTAKFGSVIVGPGFINDFTSTCQIFVGTVPPTNGPPQPGVFPIGKDGDLFVQVSGSTSTLYQKSSNTWNPIGSASGLTKADLYDPVDTSTTSGPAIINPFVVDGVTVSNGQLVLFSNLGTGNNQIYQAAISGGSISWTAVDAFDDAMAPQDGDVVILRYGTAFAQQIGTFNGTTWNFNNVVRYFTGTDYFEQSAINTASIADNQTNQPVFTLAYAGSQNILVDYSVLRGGVKEAGNISITTDGTNVAIETHGAVTGLTGVTFSAALSGPNLILQYTSTSTGSGGTMKYSIKRWSDASGGPAGPPSYSGGSAAIPAAGSNGNVQFNLGGFLGANVNFNWDNTNLLLSLGLKQLSILTSVPFSDNQTSPATLVSMPSSFNAVIITYSISRSTNFRTGRIMLTTDGVSVTGSDDYVEQGVTGVTWSYAISGSNIELQYTSTATGMSGTFKYSFERWTA